MFWFEIDKTKIGRNITRSQWRAISHWLRECRRTMLADTII